jgi:hypothetical protein
MRYAEQVMPQTLTPALAEFGSPNFRPTRLHHHTSEGCEGPRRGLRELTFAAAVPCGQMMAFSNHLVCSDEEAPARQVTSS